MTVICKECGAKMPTQKILELHMNKRHGGADKKEETVIKPEEQPVNPPVGVDSKFAEPVVTVPEVEPGMVEIISADGRVLEVSIGGDIWTGKTIFVPKDKAEDVRRILEAGGFFIKN